VEGVFENSIYKIYLKTLLLGQFLRGSISAEKVGGSSQKHIFAHSGRCRADS